MAKVAYRHYAPTRTQTRNTFQSFGGATMGTLVVKLGSPRRIWLAGGPRMQNRSTISAVQGVGRAYS